MLWPFVGAIIGLILLAVFFTGVHLGSRAKEAASYHPDPPPKKHLVNLGEMTVSEALCLSIPTTELFASKGPYYFEFDKMPDEVWMTWPKGRRVRLWWYTSEVIPR